MKSEGNMKPLVIYHGNCADGFGAAWVFSRFQPEPMDYHPGVYQDAPPDVAGRDVYLLDFSYKRPVVEAMLESAASVTLIDHHKTALDDLAPIMGRMRCHCGLDHSGAMLAWQFLCGDSPPPPLLKPHRGPRPVALRAPATRERSRPTCSRTPTTSGCGTS
jgi:hypothetical protein